MLVFSLDFSVPQYFSSSSKFYLFGCLQCHWSHLWDILAHEEPISGFGTWNDFLGHPAEIPWDKQLCTMKNWELFAPKSRCEMNLLRMHTTPLEIEDIKQFQGHLLVQVIMVNKLSTYQTISWQLHSSHCLSSSVASITWLTAVFWNKKHNNNLSKRELDI